MTDNTTLPGTGEVFAADDVSGVKYQLVKLVDGTADGTGKIAGDASNGLDVDVTRLPALGGGVAHDAAASGGNPFLAGLTAYLASLPTAVTGDGDVVRAIADRYGTQYVTLASPTRWQYVTGKITDSITAATVAAAPAAGLKNYVTDIIFSAVGAQTFQLMDGTDVLLYASLPATTMHSIKLTNPLAGTAATALKMTTTTDVDCSIVICGYVAA
jgi:hypothetical protein